MKRSKLSWLLINLLIIMLSSELNAQTSFNLKNDVILTQYWEMPVLLNPASSGGIDFVRIRGGARLQWLGVHDSPKNFVGTIDTPFKIGDKKFGGGLIVNNSSFDFFDNIFLAAQLSYKINIGKSVFSLGIQGGYYRIKFKGSKLKIDNDHINEDEVWLKSSYLPTNDLTKSKFDLGLGLRFDNPNFHVGLSGLHLTDSSIKLYGNKEITEENNYVDCKLPATFYLDLGGNINLKNSLFKLQPSILVGTDFNNFNAVIETRTTYNEKFTFGLDYRWNEAVGIFAGIYLKDFYIGYAWEYAYVHSAKGSYGNHELVLGYQFKLDLGSKKKYSYKSIRLM